jgi:hypothetical protein
MATNLDSAIAPETHPDLDPAEACDVAHEMEYPIWAARRLCHAITMATRGRDDDDSTAISHLCAELSDRLEAIDKLQEAIWRGLLHIKVPKAA